MIANISARLREGGLFIPLLYLVYQRARILAAKFAPREYEYEREYEPISEGLNMLCI